MPDVKIETKFIEKINKIEKTPLAVRDGIVCTLDVAEIHRGADT